MSTIKDVAKLAGVSVATVSNILNHKSYVSNEKYELVMRAIKELNYIKVLTELNFATFGVCICRQLRKIAQTIYMDAVTTDTVFGVGVEYREYILNHRIIHFLVVDIQKKYSIRDFETDTRILVSLCCASGFLIRPLEVQVSRI